MIVPDVPIRRAATVVCGRAGPHPDAPPEYLLLQRSSRQAFMPDLWVFPGGRVDPEDGPEDLVETFRQTAWRETLEESGLRLPRGPWPEIGRWVTPPGERRRYDTRFFLATVARGEAHVTIDASEVVDARWLSAEAALGAHRGGTLALAPPTWATLSALAPHPSLEAALRWAEALAPPAPLTPTLETWRGRMAVRWAGGALWFAPLRGPGQQAGEWQPLTELGDDGGT
jgi:8-oxo-dGTP pyrophosphatase MutT (NUDIX family)